MGTLFIPNTLAILRKAPHPEGARRLVDYLLRPEVEKALAESESHQIPLNPQVQARLPPEMEPALTAKRMQVDFDRAADLWDEAQAFVIKEFARP
jgi:iron(III) transport system substrate-binding protein